MEVTVTGTCPKNNFSVKESEKAGAVELCRQNVIVPVYSMKRWEAGRLPTVLG